MLGNKHGVGSNLWKKINIPTTTLQNLPQAIAAGPRVRENPAHHPALPTYLPGKQGICPHLYTQPPPAGTSRHSCAPPPIAQNGHTASGHQMLTLPRELQALGTAPRAELALGWAVTSKPLPVDSMLQECEALHALLHFCEFRKPTILSKIIKRSEKDRLALLS